MGMFLYCDCNHISSHMYNKHIYKQERRRKKCTKDGLVSKKFLNNQSSVVVVATYTRERDEEKLFHYNTNVTGLPFFLSLFPYLLLPFRTVYCFWCRIILFSVCLCRRLVHDKLTNKKTMNAITCCTFLHFVFIFLALLMIVLTKCTPPHITFQSYICSMCSCRMIQWSSKIITIKKQPLCR